MYYLIRLNKNMEHFTRRQNCRVCGGINLSKVLDLGSMPPANAFLKKEDFAAEESFPLTVIFCKDCFLLQVPEVIDAAILFKDYDYITSASKPLAEHFMEMGKVLKDRFISSKEDLMIEIGGNDGTLLGAVKDDCKVLNIDPAENIASLAREKDVETLVAFFNQEVAAKVRGQYGAAKVVVANNVMAHIDDIRGVFSGVSSLLSDDGTFVFEVHWVGNLIGDGGFDQIYHEHLCYYSLLSLNTLIESIGLHIFDVEFVPIHGKSLRVFAGKKQKREKAVNDIFALEKDMGLDKEDAFKAFSQKVEKNKAELLDLFSRLKKEGKKIAGYGAPAKGNTLLNFVGIGPDVVDYLTDTTPMKQGLYSPGMHIPVVTPEKLLSDRPDYILLLAWNYAGAILKKEEALRASGIKFIIPVPEVRII
jgi:SAM-dependent methyltransferase